jgi:OOP family OmpA-OmpF porin
MSTVSRGAIVRRNAVRAFWIGALSAALAACAGPPPRPDSLDAADAAVSAARSDPEVQQYAAQQLATAESSLQTAENAWQDNQPIAEIDPLAYLAERRAAIANAVAEQGQSEATLQSLAAEMDRVRLEAREAELAQAKQRAESAESELRQLQEELEAVRTERGLVVSLGSLLFDVDRAELKPGGRQRLQRVADFLIGHPDRNAVIEGHTDSTGPNAYNQELSQRRANAVELYLISLGIDQERLAARGYGEQFPVASNETTAGRQENRRVEIVILDPGQPLPPPRTSMQ